jgi:hypothetical protein
MIPSDRPVLGEPVETGRARPFRIRLGDAMHLNGALKRGTDARTVVPKRCPCGVLFLAIGKGAARAKFCDECKATQRCRSCNHIGAHAATCAKGRSRPCRGCGEELGHDGHALYCDACRSAQCPECRAFAGRHGARCRYESRPRRPGRTVYYGVVSEQEIVDLYLAERPRAVGLARAICGTLAAEDIVQDVTVALLAKRDYFSRAPGAKYFLTAVRHGRSARSSMPGRASSSAWTRPTCLSPSKRWRGRADPARR